MSNKIQQWTYSELYAGKGGIKKDKRSHNNMKDLMGTAVGGMAGLGALGQMNQIPGMPKNNVTGLASTGVNLALIGNVAKIGTNIIPQKKKHKK